MALPTVLRSVFRSELTCDLRSSPVRQWTRPLKQAQCPRPFTSTARFDQSQNEQPQSSNPVSDTPSPPESSTSNPATPSDSSALKKAKRDKTSGQENKDRKGGRDGKRSTDRKESRKAADKDKKHDAAKKQPKKPRKPEPWEIQKDALEKKFPTGWNPAKKLSPDALDGIRHLHATAPDQFTTAVLADEFKVSPEAIRRILKSKWRPKEEEVEKRRARWEKRHERIWTQLVELGLRPPTQRSREMADSNALYEDEKKP
ncbi:hypothetical protein N7532_000725 [Penicillium argentinense]|uniref:Required for respiratory growth protein 9, mitochondrial n=1 Tax=Penicillium argentinense TaxID=1131581 RepID=A0A9W9KNK8_9EURO|nr:uncharacterized protein N7532_000725 [Penicillium argentinense]KAJ5112680.1 hypothetical protein N7532_000725 [Penicillium argentinense]